MALTGVPRIWLLNLPTSSVASWEELRNLFLAHYAAPAPRSLQLSWAARRRHPQTDTQSRYFARSVLPLRGKELPQVG